MGTIVNTLKGSINHISFNRLYDIFTGDTREARITFMGLTNRGSSDSLFVRIEKCEGQWAVDGLALYATTTWQHTSYKIKIVFTFHADGNPKKVAGAYEMEENVLTDDRELGKD